MVVPVPGAAQRELKASGALQTRERYTHCARTVDYFSGFNFFRRCASVRRRSAFKRMNPAASR